MTNSNTLQFRILRLLLFALVAFGTSLDAAGSAWAKDFGDTLILGDSITQGALVGDHQSYRYELWKQFVDGGDTYELVGSHRNNYNHSNTSDTSSTSTYPDYLGQSFDADHEGHWGWKTTDVLGTTTSSFGSSSGMGNLTDWLIGYTPDTALILLGVNDVKFSVGASVPFTKINIQTIIGSLKADNPAVDIYLGSVLPSRRGFANQSLLQMLNLEYQSIAASDPAVTYVDLWTGLDGATHLYDGIHPNPSGEQLVATRFYNVMTAVPEPTTLVLLGLGGFSVLFRQRSKATV